MKYFRHYALSPCKYLSSWSRCKLCNFLGLPEAALFWARKPQEFVACWRASVHRKRQIIRWIRETVAVLLEVRVLIAELMFTAAALYACYIAYKFLVHRVL